MNEPTEQIKRDDNMRIFERLGDELIEQEVLRNRVSDLCARGLPVRLHLGPGHAPKDGFINIDRNSAEPAKAFFGKNPKDYIMFPFAERP